MKTMSRTGVPINGSFTVQEMREWATIDQLDVMDEMIGQEFGGEFPGLTVCVQDREVIKVEDNGD